MKSIEALVSEAAFKHTHNVEVELPSRYESFQAGARFATGLVFDRIIERLKWASEFEGSQVQIENVCNWLLANRSAILGIKGEVYEGEK